MKKLIQNIPIKLLFLFAFLSMATNLRAQESKIKNNAKSEVDEIVSLATKYFLQEDYKTSLKYIEKGFDLSRKTNQRKSEGHLLSLEAHIYLNRGLPQKAIVKFSESQKIGIYYHDSLLILSAIHGKARAYIELKLYREAIKILNEGIENQIQKNDLHKLGYFNNALGMAYSELGLHEKSIIYYTKYLENSILTNDSSSIIYAYVNIGEVYFDLRNFDLSLKYMKKADSLNKTVNDGQAKAAILGNFGKLYFEMGEYDFALTNLRHGIAVCEHYNNGRFQPENYQLLIKLYKTKLQDDSALWASQQLINFQDSVFEEDKINTIQYLSSYFSMEEKLHNSELVAQKLKNRTLIMIFSIGSSILFILFLALLFSRYKLKMRLYQKEKTKLNLTIDEKNRELVGKVLNQSQSNEISKDILGTLEKALKEGNLQNNNSLLMDIKSRLTRTRPGTFDWENFKIHFEQVHPQFFEKLKNVNFNLTINDLRHCSYIRMNLTTKEIAGLLNVSDRSVQTARYRIKKKLKLDQNIDLSNYLHSL